MLKLFREQDIEFGTFNKFGLEGVSEKKET